MYNTVQKNETLFQVLGPRVEPSITAAPFVQKMDRKNSLFPRPGLPLPISPNILDFEFELRISGFGFGV